MASSIRSIVSGNTNVAEISPAFANINFDFTLCRVEAPAEFHGVGRALTRGRREAAESGQSHITARILGRLFTGALPKTPNLTRVYGVRASEISKSATEDSSKTQSRGFFADHSGADGTTIWASATSGPESIPTHLLACLLARAWDPSEAISIWEELVRKRREIIMDDFARSNIADLRDVGAAKHPLSRDHLAEWDNSARSWLRTADRVKQREQKQVLLIFDNVEQQIRSDQGTYESVLSAWREALTFFEAIVSGISQKAGNGQSLLALCAWHLYPELMVVDPIPKQTKQNDALMPTKVIVTIGLGQKLGERDGICWSLPLAYLRHYGPAVKRESVINSMQRLSVKEFEMAFFGTFIVGWTELGVTLVQIAQWLSRVHQILLQGKLRSKPARDSLDALLEACRGSTWLGILFDSSKRFLKSFQAGNNNDRQLVRLGKVHGQSFLGENGDPFFGLSSAEEYMEFFKTEEDRIVHLREMASNLPGDANSMFIRVKHACRELESGAVFEYVTAKPMPRKCAKRDSSGCQLTSLRHCRWMYNGGDLSKHTTEMCYILRLVKLFPKILNGIWQPFDQIEQCSAIRASTIMSHVKDSFSRIDMDSNGWTKESRPSLLQPSNTFAEILSLDFQKRQTICHAMGEDIQLRENHVIEDYRSEEAGLFWTTYSDPPLPSKSCWYRKIYGNESASLYVLESKVEEITPKSKAMSMRRFLDFFDTDLVDADWLAPRLLSSLRNERPRRRTSLEAVSIAATIYRCRSDATIDVRALQQDLSRMHWMDQTRNSPFYDIFFPATLDLASTFSCICFFESGRFDIEVSALQRVIALSAGDTIWVASPLLKDPYSTLLEIDGRLNITEKTSPKSLCATVVAFTGNVGRPGISFLVPPVEPMIRERSIHDFRRIAHDFFDGNLGNDFHGTSLHLSFTSAKSSISGFFEGLKDTELEVLETALSVYERGEWVADLDVLKSITKASMPRILPCPDCRRRRNGEMPRKGLIGENKPGVTAITNWTELLDPPETTYSIVKATGNWEARLAATVIAVASGYHVCVLPDIWCWGCPDYHLYINTKWILIA